MPLLLGGVVLRLVVTGTYRSYVKDSMWPWLTLTGLGLLVLAGWDLLARRAEGGGHRPPVAWLLLLPVVAVVGVAPGALGSAALDRASRPAARLTPDGRWAALPRDQGPVELTMGEFVDRSQAGTTTVGVPVTLTGFVAPDEDGTSRFRVVRFRISCCAADAAPVAVRVVGDAVTEVPRTDSWVTVTGTLEPDTPAALEPRLRVTAVVEIPQPSAPYESVVR
jgi:uncharacterized repeat protein (TIGR03943 family)